MDVGDGLVRRQPCAFLPCRGEVFRGHRRANGGDGFVVRTVVHGQPDDAGALTEPIGGSKNPGRAGGIVAEGKRGKMFQDVSQGQKGSAVRGGGHGLMHVAFSLVDLTFGLRDAGPRQLRNRLMPAGRPSGRRLGAMAGEGQITLRQGGVHGVVGQVLRRELGMCGAELLPVLGTGLACRGDVVGRQLGDGQSPGGQAEEVDVEASCDFDGA